MRDPQTASESSRRAASALRSCTRNVRVLGWFSLNHTTTGEGDDPAVVQATAERLAPLLQADGWPTSSAELKWRNGELYLVVSGLVNRRRFEADALDDMLGIIARDLPGSYGLLYERDDGRTETPGPDAFTVRVMTKGNVETRLDPFLSPAVPTIEDELDEDSA